MRSQGMAEQADRFAYRFPAKFGAWLFSWFLFLLAGYGYRPVRTLLWYVASWEEWNEKSE